MGRLKAVEMGGCWHGNGAVKAQMEAVAPQVGGRHVVVVDARNGSVARQPQRQHQRNDLCTHWRASSCKRLAVGMEAGWAII